MARERFASVQLPNVSDIRGLGVNPHWVITRQRGQRFRRRQHGSLGGRRDLRDRLRVVLPHQTRHAVAVATFRAIYAPDRARKRILSATRAGPRVKIECPWTDEDQALEHRPLFVLAPESMEKDPTPDAPTPNRAVQRA